MRNNLNRTSTRREFLCESALGFGTLAMAYLDEQTRCRAAEAAHRQSEFVDLRPRQGHFPAKAMLGNPLQGCKALLKLGREFCRGQGRILDEHANLP